MLAFAGMTIVNHADDALSFQVVFECQVPRP